MGPAWVTCPSLSQSLGWGTCSWCPRTVLPTGPCKAWWAVVSEGGRGGGPSADTGLVAAWVPHFGLLAASPPTIPVPQGLGAHPSAGSCPSGLPPAASPPARAMAWPPQPLSPSPCPTFPRTGSRPVSSLTPSPGQHTAMADSSCCVKTEAVWAGPSRHRQGTRVEHRRGRAPGQTPAVRLEEQDASHQGVDDNPEGTLSPQAPVSRHPVR